MSLPRRRFLKTCALSALGAGCALGPGLPAFAQDLIRPDPALDFQVPFEAQQSPLFYYTRATFEPYVGGVFRGFNNGGSVHLQLLRVSGYTPKAGTRIMRGRRRRDTDSFTLTFRAGRYLPKGSVHLLEHAALGRFQLFMTRYVSPRGQIFYEAVINHVV